MNFRVLNIDLELDLSETSMVGLVIEWIIRFCEFCQVPRCGLGLDVLVDFGLLIKDSTFFDWVCFLGLCLMYLSCFRLVLRCSEVATRVMASLEQFLACSALVFVCSR